MWCVTAPVYGVLSVRQAGSKHFICITLFNSHSSLVRSVPLFTVLEGEAKAQKFISLLKITQLVGGGAWMWTQAALLQSQLLPSMFYWAGMILPCGRSAVCLGHHAGISELCEGVILWHWVLRHMRKTLLSGSRKKKECLWGMVNNSRPFKHPWSLCTFSSVAWVLVMEWDASSPRIATMC